ncbi:unnamed protein product [Adineta steineri]|uniref:Uncharacterized protein n=1 Tax=Adineta steineri TaxID=433720 RepID=A0A814M013_9BILA|nr:unnamed protein product [Adineta steineri]
MMITKFEQFSDELISMCFNYFHFYELYNTFFFLNQRLNQLLLHKINIPIDFDSVPSENLLTFCFQLHGFLSRSQNHSLAISTCDEHRLNLIMNDSLFQDKFNKLKSLTLFDHHEYPVSNVRFSERMDLYQTLERLTLHEIREGDADGSFLKQLCNELISSKMKSLKYLNISFSPYRCGCPAGDHHGTQDVEFEFDYLPEEEKSFSNLETLIIGNIPDENRTWTSTQVSIHVLTKELLPRLPKLNKLMINAVHFDQDRSLQLIGVSIKRLIVHFQFHQK